MSRPDYRPTYDSPPGASMAPAIWALILAIFGGCCFFIPTVIGMLIGVRVINRSDETGENHGREVAIAAIGVGALHIGATIVILVLGAFAGAIESGGEYAAESANADPTLVNVATLRAGECFDDPTLHGKKGPTRHAECRARHDAEVIDRLEITAGQYPGLRAFRDRARACREAFEPYVGAPLAESELAMTFYYPTRDGWPDADTRGIACVIWDPQGPLKDTAFHSKR